MKKTFISITIVLWVFFMFGNMQGTYAATNVWIWSTLTDESNTSKNLDKLDEFQNVGAYGPEDFIDISEGGIRGLYNGLLQIARDLKNLFYALATLYFLVICIKLVFSENTEEAIWNFKKGIVWITVGIIVMQLAFWFTAVLFDKWVSARLWVSLFTIIVLPMINLVRTLASIFFIAMAIFAFYRLVTANGNEEAVKTWKFTIVYALGGFILVKLAQSIIEAFYGKVECNEIITNACKNSLDISQWVNIILNVINWLNGFVAIAVLLMIFYAGFQILLSRWDEEKIKKWKQAILYVAIWIFILLVNFLILTFFIRPESII
jgi:hypothetical protein